MDTHIPPLCGLELTCKISIVDWAILVKVCGEVLMSNTVHCRQESEATSTVIGIAQT